MNHYERYRETSLASSRRYREEHGEEINAKRREQHRANPELKNARSRQWRKDNPSKVRNAYLMKTYGISLEQYELLLKSQDGVCAICGGVPRGRGSDKGVYVVDHCHETGHVHGLLCSPCNAAIGSLNDDPVLIKKAAEYLCSS